MSNLYDEFTPKSETDQRWDKLTAEMLLGFTEWSQGFIPVERALRQIVRTFGAEHGTISRVNTMSGRIRIVASSNMATKLDEDGFEHSFAHPVLGEEVAKLKSGSLVLMTQIEDTQSIRDPEIEEFLSKRNLNDIGLICLLHKNNWVDFLELYFEEAPSRAWSTACEWGADAFARTYRIRRPGLVSEAMARRFDSDERSDNYNHAILSSENAYGLTRSEWNVCVFVSRGLTAKAVADVIGVTTSTVRSHLRKIYQKTSLGNYHRLARRLVSPAEQSALHRGAQEKIA